MGSERGLGKRVGEEGRVRISDRGDGEGLWTRAGLGKGVGVEGERWWGCYVI